MQNKVILFSNQTNKNIEKSLINRGLFHFTYIFCDTYEHFVQEIKSARETCEKIIVSCKNELIDKLLDEVKKEDDQFSVLFEQAVKLEERTTFRKMLFVPSELDAEKFLDVFLEKKEVFSCSIFGKTVRTIEEKFKDFDCDFKIFSENKFLHIVKFSKAVEEEKLKEAFGDGVFSFEGESLQGACEKILKEKNLSFAVAEGITAGGVSCKLAGNLGLKQSVVLLNDEGFEQVQIDKPFLENNGTVSKETSYEVSKNLLINADIALSVLGFDCDAGRTFVAVGNKDEIHVFSSVFYGNRQQIVENAICFGLFKLLAFIKEKY
ncbi:MAG: CinA family protein [Clostridia bacterium]|nr:CinA family protein [Clostridia bacterium]